MLPGALSPILTPVDSSDEENGQRHHDSPAFRHWRPGKTSPSRRPPMLTVDTAMDIDMVVPPPLISGDSLSPWPASVNRKGNPSLQASPIPHHLINQSLTISGGRTATPIYDHFTVNMRPERMQEEPQTAGTLVSTTRSQLLQTQESLWWQRRRLPSPISEGGDVVSEHKTETMDTRKDAREFPDKDRSDKKSDWLNLESSMEVDGQEQSAPWLTVPRRMTEQSAHSHSSTSELTPATNPAAVGQNLAPTKSKTSFTMGYRADCEKCRLKVPGHYSHIVRS